MSTVTTAKGFGHTADAAAFDVLPRPAHTSGLAAHATAETAPVGMP